MAPRCAFEQRQNPIGIPPLAHRLQLMSCARAELDRTCTRTSRNVQFNEYANAIRGTNAAHTVQLLTVMSEEPWASVYDCCLL